MRCRRLLWLFFLTVVPALGATADDAAVLTIRSDPKATVVVDGVPRGETPSRLSDLSAGNHRVLLVRTGYEREERDVRLTAGRGLDLDVRMRPVLTSSTAAAADDPSAGGTNPGKKKGGGKAKWIVGGLLLGGGGAAAGIAVANKNDPPLAALGVTPPGDGMAGATVFAFSGGRSSDPDNDPLSFVWNFGDGATGKGSEAKHVYTSPGTYDVTLTVYDGFKPASASGKLRVLRNLAGAWRGDIRDRYGNTFDARVTFAQYGATLTGTYSDSSGSGVVSGSVNSSNNFVCSCAVSLTIHQPPFRPFQFSGQVDAGLTRITGTLSGSGFENVSWTLTR